MPKKDTYILLIELRADIMVGIRSGYKIIGNYIPKSIKQLYLIATSDFFNLIGLLIFVFSLFYLFDSCHSDFE